MLRLASVFDRLGVAYAVGGSVASSLHGIPRATQDVDVVAALLEKHVEPIVAELMADFYVDADMIRDAIRRRASFNVIHLASMLKVDVFLPKDALAREEMLRRRPFVVDEATGDTLQIASAEDVVLQKLDWYRLGQGISDRQWQDVLGVLKVQRGRLDVDYLRRWAELTALTELLERALSEAQGS